MITRRAPAPREGLRLELVDVLLDDFPSSHRTDDYDVFYKFEFALRRQLPALRAQYRELLVAEAVTRGLDADHVDRLLKGER